MRKQLLFAVGVLLAFSFAKAESVDLKGSKIIWKGTKVVGSSHTGEVKIKSADLKFKGGEPQSGTVVVDMNSITNKDVTDKKYNKKLVDHLKSDAFFGVAKHKTATLTIKKIEKASDKFYFVVGDLKIRGISQPVKLKAEVTSDAKSEKVVKIDFKFDRTKFNVKYNSGSLFENLGDKMISDEIELSVQIKINKDKKLASN